MEAAEKEEISVEDEAVDKTIFKDCGKIAFYRRQKQQLTKTTTYQALLGSVDTEQDSTRFQIISEATKIPLVAEVYGIEKDIFRLKINEETPLKPRYEVPDVINSKLGTVRLVCSGDTGSLILTNRKGDLKCHVSANPFKIDLLSKNEAVISINSLGQLYFEHLQVPHKQRATKGNGQNTPAATSQVMRSSHFLLIFFNTPVCKQVVVSIQLFCRRVPGKCAIVYKGATCPFLSLILAS